MFYRTALILGVTLATLLVAACDVDTTVDYDREFDFSTLQTYRWAGRPHPEITDLMHQRIVAAVDGQLQNAGLSQVEADPDVYVTYFGDDNERVVVDTTHHGYGYGPSWHWGGGFSSSTSRVRTYTDGTLVVDIYTADNRRHVWRGSVTGTISENPQKNEDLIKKGLARVFKKYPPE